MKVRKLKTDIETLQAMMVMDTECAAASKLVLENETDSLKQRLQLAENEA